MAKKVNRATGKAGIQIFELTMDNPENQDDLNRQLQKPGESTNGPSAMRGRKVKVESTAKSAEKNGRSND